MAARQTPARGVVAALLVLAAAALAGCDQNCQDACAKVYDASQCYLRRGGITAAAVIRDCEDRCQDALANTGPMGDYNPFQKRDPLDPKTITNEKQAAAWMDCVAQAECPELDPAFGLCEPI